jgi:hypothetical protein
MLDAPRPELQDRWRQLKMTSRVARENGSC